MRNDNWEQYKKIYKGITVSADTVDTKWENLSVILPPQEHHSIPNYARIGFAFLAIILLFTIGLVGTSQQAKPGDTLYTVKQLTEQLRINVLKGPEQKPKQVPDESVIKKPSPTVIPSPTKAPTPSPTTTTEVKSAKTQIHLEKMQEKKVIPQTGQAVKQNGNSNGNGVNNETKHENNGNNSNNNNTQNGQDKPKNDNAEQKGNSENKSQRNK